jgi:sulfatase maturation enzyme AslB (radical SAM superfamily)
MKNYIRLRSGSDLTRTIDDYDKSRPDIRTRTLKAVCYAPFLSMDFDATGAIRICNHSHTAVANMSEDTSVIDIWRGEIYRGYRAEMQDYVLDEDNCRHCVRQCTAGSGSHVFAVEQFDAGAHDDAAPLYPKRLIFRLNSTCNLACIMCDGLTSSRIRRERDKLPPTPSMYGERFFKDMEEILPHADHVEFYGGEPFLVREHLRIFEILTKVKASCTVYVNTNGVALHNRAKKFLEELNFKTIAVSMDAVSDELHKEIRYGLRSELFYRNMDYFLDLRRRRGVYVMLNVTEHRKNWFELPEIFRYAEKKQLYIHINTCIHPHNVTLYTLPSEQLNYVLTFLKEKREELLADYRRFSNLPSYDFLLSLIRSELDSRKSAWQPIITNRNQGCDGFLAAPLPGLSPFETPEKVSRESDRIVKMVGGQSAMRMLSQMLARVRKLSAPFGWPSVAQQIDRLIAGLPECASGTVFQ